MSKLQFTPIEPFIGAFVSGLDLSKSIDEGVSGDIIKGWRRYKVLVFRHQNITREQHLAFGRNFGVPECHPAFGERDLPEIIAIHEKPGKEVGEWHTDVTYQPAPPKAAILHSWVVPPLGGDTIFINTSIAYERLSPEMKKRINHLQAEHAPGFERLITDPERLAKLNADNPPVLHPVVAVHPDTGEKILYVNEYFTTRIVGLEKRDSDDLLLSLFDHIKRPEYQLRVDWEPNMVVMWDELVTQHYAVADYSEPRHLDRVTLSGSRPVAAF